MNVSMQQILQGQFEAALAMLKQCIEKCPAEHWESKIANNTIREVVYHTLFFVDYDLSPTESAFELRELHRRGGDERRPEVSAGLSQQETFAYLAVCRQKLLDTLATETVESLQGPSGFARHPMTRGEMHFHTVRHVMHHVGALSATLRRLGVAVGWVRTGWE